MIINVANFNFGGDSGGGGKPALLQEKTATIVQNGIQTITPDEGFDGMSSVKINAAITGASSAIDFSSIGYDSEFSAELNAKLNNDVAYSKTLYDAWDPSRIGAQYLYQYDKKLVYAPNIDTRNITTTEYMFGGCSSLTSVPLYNTSKVTYMYGMFSGCKSLTTVKLFDTSKVDDMESMFARCTSLKTVPLFDTSNLKYMNDMFNGCSGLTSVPLFDTSQVISMINLFSDCKSLTSVPLFNTSNVVNMMGMFSGCTSLQTVPLFDTSNAKYMDDMFNGCSELTTVPEFDTSNATTIYSMFEGCTSLTTIPAFNTSKSENFSNMFSGCTSITTIPELDTSNAKYMNDMFYDCPNLTTIEGISFKSYSDSTMNGYKIFGFGNTSIRKAVLKDIGYNSNTKEFEFYYLKNWGVNSDEITDARQSLIDSLITYSFDRAAAGYPTCTIGVSSNTKALLTADEIAQIEAKGFTIA